MARFLVTTTPLIGHVTPMTTIVKKLVERGHEVLWYSTQQFRAKIESTGSRFAPYRVATDYDSTDLEAVFPEMKGLKGPALLKMQVRRVFIDPVPSQLEDLQALLEHYPADVMLTDNTSNVGGVLRYKLGLPWAAISIMPLSFSSIDAPPFGLGMTPLQGPLNRIRNRVLNWALKNLLFRDLQAYANAMLVRLNMPPSDKTVFDLSPNLDLFLHLTIPELEYPRTDLASQVHFVGPLLPGPAADFVPPAWWHELEGDRLVVHVTQGTVATDPNELLIPTLKALANEDVLVVATTGGRPVETLGELPANVRVERFIPHYHLLPHVDVMVTNAGYGGFHAALASGVPLVTAGASEDKPEVSARAAWAGVGVNLKTQSPTVEAVRDAVRKVLDTPQYRERARAVQSLLAQRQPTVEAAVLLERLAVTRQPIKRTTATMTAAAVGK